MPILSKKHRPADDERTPKTYCSITGRNCESAYDCMQCIYMQAELQATASKYHGWQWLCHDCVRGVRDDFPKAEIAGYFTDGKCEARKCVRGEDRDSFMLQLVLFARQMLGQSLRSGITAAARKLYEDLVLALALQEVLLERLEPTVYVSH